MEAKDSIQRATLAADASSVLSQRTDTNHIHIANIGLEVLRNPTGTGCICIEQLKLRFKIKGACR
jgi:hypothetical protein